MPPYIGKTGFAPWSTEEPKRLKQAVKSSQGGSSNGWKTTLGPKEVGGKGHWRKGCISVMMLGTFPEHQQ